MVKRREVGARNSMPNHKVADFGEGSCLIRIFLVNIFFSVGDRTRVKFWEDRWCGALPFKVYFPDLYMDYRTKN